MTQAQVVGSQPPLRPARSGLVLSPTASLTYYGFRWRALIRSSVSGTLACGRFLSSGYRSNHRFNASSELKRLLASQPPPLKTMVLAGSALTNCPLSNMTRMRVVLSGDESLMVIRSDPSLPLTSDRKSDAQSTQNVRPDASDTR